MLAHSPPYARMVVSGAAKGGPYIGVHWRRRDFLRGHNREVPSVEGTFTQLKALCDTHRVDKVFMATDSTNKSGEFCVGNFFGVTRLCFHRNCINRDEMTLF